MDVFEFRLLITTYQRIVNSRSVEFYADNCWNQLEVQWKSYLDAVSIEELVSYVNSQDNVQNNVPESLRNLKDRLVILEYGRKCVQDPTELWKRWTNTKIPGNLQNEFRLISTHKLLRKKIKSKKQHEIDRIVELISQIQLFNIQKEGLSSIDSLVDIGSGVGHLSRMISLHNNLAVMAVEGNHQFTLAANSLDEKLLQNSAKFVSQEDINIETTPARFTDFVTEDMAQKVDDFAVNSAILVGLHCCGDFSSTILRIFINSRKARALVLLGCCYHKEFQCFQLLNPENKSILKTDSEQHTRSTVFPMSKKWKDCELSYVSRESACHNNENMGKRFLSENTDLSRYARAHLEKWIWSVSNCPEDRNIGMCSVKCVQNETTFEEYIRKAMAKRGSHLLNKVLEVVPKCELSSQVSSLKSAQFDAFDVIRLMFAPAIESAIIDDRISYLNEYGIHAKCVPLFDPKISPRNLAIVAYKD